MLEGTAIRALIVGGGPVAARKAQSLADAQARVRVVATSVCAELTALAKTVASVSVSEKLYDPADIGDATLVFAATDDSALNDAVAAAARARGLLVNVADAPEHGTFVTPAVHRSGDIVIAVATGGVPTASRRIRDAIARVVDGRYASAVASLAALRQALLASGHRDRWREAAGALTGPDFSEQVESGRFAEQVVQWR
jgi:precorrin-2 dehydrogenase/sirohydrochlorin ferrochelatase